MTSIQACERDYDVLLAKEAILGPKKEKVDAMLYILKTYGIEPVPIKTILDKIE